MNYDLAKPRQLAISWRLNDKTMNATTATPIKTQENWPNLLVKLSDILSIGIGLYFFITWFPEIDSKSTILVGLIGIVTFHLIAEFTGLYRRWMGIAFEKEVVTTIFAWTLSFTILAVIGQFSLYATEISGPYLYVWCLNCTVISLSFRMLYRWMMRWQTDRGINTRNFAVVGVTELGIELSRNISRTPDLGLKLRGFYDDRPEDRTVTLPCSMDQKLGTINDLVESAKKGEIDVIFITLPMRAESRIKTLIREFSDSAVSVYIVPDLFVFQMLHSRWTDVQGIPIVSVFENPLYGVDGVLKRSVDIALASVALVLLAVPMLLIALAVKLTSRGPILFQQLRYGLDGKPIKVLKFRSMTVMENGDQVTQAQKNDSRLTPIGGFLRRSSLDELPQLFNVLGGSMSLVGPRPHANAHNEFYRRQINGYMLRHKIKPGITGLAQVNGCRGETETVEKMEARVKYDHQYIREWNLALDFQIMLKTIRVVLARQNAY